MTQSLTLRARRNRQGMALAGLAFALTAGLLRLGLALLLQGTFPSSTLVTARDGSVLRLTTAPDGQYRLWTALSEFPSETIEAVLLKEDRSFWTNVGVDSPALIRAVWHSVVVKDYRTGASTLTMQTVRLAARLDTSTVPGKLTQMAGALVLTALLPKRDILETYLNLAPCGGNVQGLGTASRIWFGKPPARLNLSESLALAVLPQDPSHRNPASASDLPAIETARQRLAASWMTLHPQNDPDLDRRLEAQLSMPLTFRRSLPFLAPHVVARLIAERPAARKIQTTLDLGYQRLLEGSVRAFVRRNASLGVNNAAALLVKADSMEVLASVGSADFYAAAIDGQVDGTRALRSPGSTLKPFLYALALEQGLIHPLTSLKDARVHFGGYNPDNFDNDFEGPISAVDALVKSRNVPAVILAGQVRNPDLYGFLQSAGLGLPFSREHYGLSIILGGAEVTMEDLVRLYGALALPGGQAGLTRGLQYVVSDSPAPPNRLLTAGPAWLVRKMLETKARPDEGSGWDASPVQADASAELARGQGSRGEALAVAYKTGTSIGFRDAWSVGLADGMILAVWVGDFRGTSNPEFIGLNSAAPLMFEMIDAWRSSARFESSFEDATAPGVVFVPVCAVSGGLATQDCPRVVRAPFLAGVSPIASCTVHRVFHVDQATGLSRTHAIPGVTDDELYEVWPSDLLQLFAEAGLARAVPPPFDPADTQRAVVGESAPVILSPVKGLAYGLGSGDDRVPLAAAVSSDATQVWWFVDEKLVGKAPRGETLLWSPVVGRHRVRIVDDRGRSAAMGFEVIP